MQYWSKVHAAELPIAKSHEAKVRSQMWAWRWEFNRDSRSGAVWRGYHVVAMFICTPTGSGSVSRVSKYDITDIHGLMGQQIEGVQ